MITLRPGSHSHNIVTLLSIVGEFPTKSLHLLGNQRLVKRTIHKMESTQLYRLPHQDASIDQLETQLLQVVGNGALKSLRFTSSGVSVLPFLGAGAYKAFMELYSGNRFQSDQPHRERNHRVGEVAAACMSAGIESRPYVLPPLQNRQRLQVVPQGISSFYISKCVKGLTRDELDKTAFTRQTGILFTPTQTFATYNTRGTLMKWGGMGEIKARMDILSLSRYNAGIGEVDSALLFGEPGIAQKTMEGYLDNRRTEHRFDSIYPHIHFIPLNAFGVRLLRIFTVPYWRETLLGNLFDESERAKVSGSIEYDALSNDRLTLSFLDSDIARLTRLYYGLQALPPAGHMTQVEVVCYPEQIPLLRAFLGNTVTLSSISLDAVYDVLNLNGGES